MTTWVPTQEDIEAVGRLYAQGTGSVRLSDGSEIRYAPDLLQRLREMEARASRAASPARTVAGKAAFRRAV